MKSVTQAMLEQIYTQAIKIAHGKKYGRIQSIHDEKSLDDGNYYITLAQLESILQEFED